jgi:hypothetical protein
MTTNKLVGYYKNDGTKVIDLVDSNFVQLELIGNHAKDNSDNDKDNIILVSTSILSEILHFQWYLGKTGYPVTYQSIDKKIKFGRGIKMHRLIMPKQEKGYVIDHINRNKLDNRFTNLRICTAKENSYNTTKPKNSNSKYKGVKKGKNETWIAIVSKDGKTSEIKDIQTEKQAAEIYDLMAEEMFGKFAGKNFG